MQFSLSDEQVMLKSLVERLVADAYVPGKRAAYRASETGFSAGNWAQLAELGVLAAPFLPEQGGLAGGLVEIMVLMEALGRGQVVEPVLEQVVTPGRLIAHARSAVNDDAWLQRIMSGAAHVALAHFEQTAGFELDDVRTLARGNGAGVRLQGEKTVVLGTGGADAFIVSARNIGSSGAEGIGFYFVDRTAPGLSITPFRIADGSVAARLRFDDVAVREKLEVSFDAFLNAVDDSRIAACAEMIGIMSTLFETTLEHVRTRKQFGAPLGSFQVIQHRMADLYVLLEQSRSQLYRAALSGTSGRAHPAAVAGMKSYVSAAAVEMGEQCIHLHGGMGITDELLIGHGHKRLLVLASMFGDADHELQRFARIDH